MPQDLLKRVNWDLVYPRFRDRYFDVVAECRKRGRDYWALCGYRTPVPEQQALYDQGRTKPGKIVTNAKPYESAHNYAMASDSAADADSTREGLQPDWNIEDYRLLADVAKERGLEPGFYWTHFREGPHVQVPFTELGISLSTLEGILKSEGLPAVWAYVDERWK